MSRIPKWKIEKTKVKVVFRLQFHATHVPQQGWDKLFVSFIPIDTGKATAKTNKVNIRNGNCKWPDPIYETTRLLLDARTKTYDEKLYRLVVAMGSSRSSFLGEVNINLADFADALKPSSVSLPLTNCDFGTTLHVTVQLLTSKTGFREFEQQRELSVKGIQMLSSPGNDRSDSEVASSEIANELTEKVNAKVRFKEDRLGISSLQQVEESNADYEDSAGGADGSSFTSDSLCAEKNDLQIMHGMDNFKSMMCGDVPLSQSHLPRNGDPNGSQLSTQGRNDWTHGWNSNYSIDTDLATTYEENNRLRVRLEVTESAFLQLKLEAKSLQRITDELGAETQSLSKQLCVELASGEQLTREVSLLKSECSKFRYDLEALKSAKVMQQCSERRAHTPLMLNHSGEDDLVDANLQGDVTAAETHYMYHDLRVKWLESLLLIEGKVREINNKARLRYNGSDFDFLGPDFELLGCVISDLKEDIIQVKGLKRSYGVHLLSDSHKVYHEYDTLKKNLEASSLRGDNMFNFLSKLEELTTEKETLAKKMDQMQCYYESLILELEESQKQTVKELENLRNEHSSCLYSISVLQKQIEKAQQEMNEQFMAFAEDKNNIESQNKELERRAIASETALKRVRWNYSIAVDRLQKDVELLSFQVLSMYETNENLAKQTFADAYQHYVEESPKDTSTCNVNDGTFTSFDQEHYQSGGSRGQTENGPYGISCKWSPLDNGISTSVLSKNKGEISQVGVPLRVQLHTKGETKILGFCSDKASEQASHHTQEKKELAANLSPVTSGDEVHIRSTTLMSKIDTQCLDNAEATGSGSRYANGQYQHDADGVEDMRKSLQMLSVLHSDTEDELLKMHFLNMDLKLFSEVILGALHDVYDGFQQMKGEMLELSQQLQHTTEVKESFMLKLHKALDDSRMLMDDKAKCISRCENLTLKNQILEAKLQDISEESTFLSEKVIEYERKLAEFKAYEKEHRVCIEERDKLKNQLQVESLQKSCLETELNSTIEKYKTLKEEFDNESSENDKIRTCFADIIEKLGYLYACMSSCNEQINCYALGGISASQELGAGNYMAVIMSLEQLHREAIKKVLQLHKEKMDIKEERDSVQSSLNKTELEYLNMRQKLESDLNEITEKLNISNSHVEKLQLELHNALEKLKINSDAEDKNELANRELSSKLTDLELELQHTIEENKDLVNQLVVLAGVKEDLEKSQVSLTNCLQEKRTLLMSIQSKNDVCSQMENELCSLKESLQITHRDMEIEKRMREELDVAVANLSAQLEEKDGELSSFWDQKAELILLQDMIVDLEKANTGFQNLLLNSEESQRKIESENLSLKTHAMDMGNQLAEILENLLAAEVRVTFISTSFFDRVQESFGQLNKLEKELEEMNLKHKNVVTTLDTVASNESQLIDENARLSIALQSLKSDYDIIFQENDSLLAHANKQNVTLKEFEDIKVKASTIEADCNRQKQKYEGEICQLKNMLIGCEEEVSNLRSSRDALEVMNTILESKLNEQQDKILLLEEYDHQLRTLQEHHNELSSKLSEQIMRTEEYKNLSIHLKELKNKADAECLMAREKKENERSSQDSLRIAFIKEQYESKIQELKNQSYVSKKYAEEMLLKLQNALDEVESRKKNEVSLAKKIDELYEKISNLESELDIVLNDRRELVQSFEKIKNELQCTILNFDCCKQEKLRLEDSLKACNEEKLNLEDSLKECNEERTKSRIELDLVKRLFDSMASNEDVNMEANNDSGFLTTASIEQILQDGSFGFCAVLQEMPNEQRIDSPTKNVTNSLKNVPVELQRTNESDKLSSCRDVEIQLSTCAGDSSLSCPLSSSPDFKDAEGAPAQKTSFTDNITDIAGIEEHFKEQQRLKSGIDMLQKELERLRNENLSSLIPLEDHQSVPSLQALERDLSQLDMANEQLGSIFPSFKELPGSGNSLERVLALELELAEALQTKKPDFRLQSSFLKQHNDDEAVFQSFRDINELIKEMLELKSRYAAVETELKEMQGRYSQLSLQFAEVEGERQKLVMTLKSRTPKRS
ncbi:sporulation-specific protein 15-like [Canna indica]|uniref:Sporulation-specific protein 15-like n=1 Tax=Canna indica TaxID=4628 RepID=A0AAQ3QHF5_9LILI|nr:sporulation-specific protein 15-like [Canna indica]